MYKLNAIQGWKFFDYQTPANLTVKKKLLENAVEIKPKRRNSQGEILRFVSMPKLFWYRDYDSTANWLRRKQQRAMSPNRLNTHKVQNPIFFKRQEIQERLKILMNRPSTLEPCKKWKKYRNLKVQKIEQTQIKTEEQQQQKRNLLETVNLVISANFLSPGLMEIKSSRSSFMSPGQMSIFAPSFKKILDQKKQKPQIIRLNRLASNKIDQSQYYNNDGIIDQSNDLNIEVKKLIQQKERFQKDSYRLYGLDGSLQTTISKLDTSLSVRLTESAEAKQIKNTHVQRNNQSSNEKLQNIVSSKQFQSKQSSPFKQMNLKDSKGQQSYFPNITTKPRQGRFFS